MLLLSPSGFHELVFKIFASQCAHAGAKHYVTLTGQASKCYLRYAKHTQKLREKALEPAQRNSWLFSLSNLRAPRLSMQACFKKTCDPLPNSVLRAAKNSKQNSCMHASVKLHQLQCHSSSIDSHTPPAIPSWLSFTFLYRNYNRLLF